MKLFLTISLFCFSFTSFGQDSIAVQKQYYQDAYNEIVAILERKQPYSFKRAVFITENAYLNNRLEYKEFSTEIFLLSTICQELAKSNDEYFLYNHSDRNDILRYATLFKLMTDTIKFAFADSSIKNHLPFTYDFDDPFGKKDWKKMFVTKLLFTAKGNCHSMPYLYKMIAEEMGLTAHLALAPNHIYIKHHSKKTGMYNTELTSAAFPIDAWLMASGYIHLDAIRSGIYMDTLDNQQSLALCLFDLAKGYEKKFGVLEDQFIMKCCNKSLEYYPNNINALLLKAELLKNKFGKIGLEHKAQYPEDIFHIQEAKELFDKYESMIVKIHKLGYRKMPERMYFDWLTLLQQNQEKYTDKNINTNFKSLKSN